MLNITKIQNGYKIDNKEYLFEKFNDENYVIVSTNQVHVGTNEGIILLDLNFTINDINYIDINNFINDLYN